MKVFFLTIVCAALLPGCVSMSRDWGSPGVPSNCLLKLHGAQGSLKCTGREVAAAVHPKLKGMILLDGVKEETTACHQEGCLITICRNSRAFLQANVTMVSFPSTESPWDVSPWDRPPWTRSILCLAGRSGISFERPLFKWNNATGIKIQQNATARVDQGEFAGNKAPAGPAIFAGDRSVVVVSRTKFLNNAADGWIAGGAMAIADEANVTIQDNTLFQDNIALQENSGGALSVNDNSTLSIVNSSFHGNNATGSGGAIATYEASRLFLTQCLVSRNRALNNSGGGSVAVCSPDSSAFIRDTIFDGNENMRVGAGDIAVYGGMVVLSGCIVQNSRCVNGHGAGFFCNQKSYALITNGTTFRNNSGGALSVRQDCVVNITGGSQIINNRPFMGYGGGGILATGNSVVMVQGGSVLAHNSAMEGPGGGAMEMNAHASVVLDGVEVRDNQASNGGGVYASGNATLNITEATVFRNNSAQVGADLNVGPGVAFNLAAGSSLDPFGSGVVWMRSKCIIGEVLDQGYCRKCLPSTFSLDPTGESSCSVCPPQANCTGGDVIASLQGCWHSTPYSTQIHRCPHVDQVCLHNGTCQKGYRGNLCGECEPGYGSAGSFNCGQCLDGRAQWALYVCAAVVAVLVVAFTVHATWQDNQDASQDVRVSDMIKVVVLFLQYLVIISSLSVPWPESVSALFRVAKFVFAATNGMVVSLDCLLLADFGGAPIPLAVQRQLVYLLAPVGVLLAVILLYTIKPLLSWVLSKSLFPVRRSPKFLHPQPHPVAARLPVMCIVVFFFAYPSLLRASLGSFACLKIDDAYAVADPYPQYATANASYGYYVHDMQQACWEGWHRPWALGLGIPCTLMFCLVAPAALTIGMFMHRAKLNQVRFRRHFGFLYRNFRQSRSWWEGVLAAQTVLLVAVSVFRYSLGGYFSVLLISVMFGLSATLQLVFKPFARRKLHRLQLVATGCLYLTTCFALSLFTFDVDSSAAYKQTIGAFAVVLNSCFLLGCCFIIAKQSWPTLAHWAACLGRLFRLHTCCGGRFCSTSSGNSSSATSSGLAHGNSLFGGMDGSAAGPAPEAVKGLVSDEADKDGTIIKPPLSVSAPYLPIV